METDTKEKDIKNKKIDMYETIEQSINGYQKTVQGNPLTQLPKYDTPKFFIQMDWHLAEKGIDPSLLEKGIARCSNKEANGLFGFVKAEYTLGRDMMYGDVIIVNNKTGKVISLV